ncbi:MAG: FAD-dependent oxidoreductase [Oscillospiraceae bacterium]|nr:FAD-dependent oxidoreductase [Oscillospiraceae bacterium]
MRNEKYSALFTPFHIGNVEIKNRFVMGPMGMGWLNGKDGEFTQEAIDFYTERAKGGFGAIITGVQLVDQKVDRPMARSPLYNKEAFLQQGIKLNQSCNAYGTKVFLEIGFGVGRNYPTFKAPSANLPAYQYPAMLTKALTRDEIHLKRDQIIEAAVLAKDSGFAGVDIHTLHWGYLLDQFALSITNRRTDEYGGSLENRLRLLRESVEGIRSECGADFPITVGLGVKSYIKALNKASLTGEDEAGRTVEEAVQIAKLLEQMGINAILCDVGIYDSFYYACPPSYMPKGHAVELYKQIKDAVTCIPVLARSRLGDPDLDASVLANGQADAIILSRPSLADPEYPGKIASGNADKIRPCIGCNMACIGRCTELRTHESCAVNPRACFETSHPPKKAVSPKKIAVVGGGVAGMQACLTASECGHNAELFERSGVLGGELNAAGAHEFKADIHRARDWFIRELKERNIPVHLNSEFTIEQCESGKYDVVIMATGAAALMPSSIKGIEKAVSAVEMLENDLDVGENVVVVGGGMVGCETAVDLAKKGKKVTLVEQLPAILSSEFVPQQHKMMLKDMIEYYGIKVYSDYRLAEVTDEGAVIEAARKMVILGRNGGVVTNIDAGNRVALPADTVIVSIGLKPVANLTQELTERGIRVIEVGSAKKAGNVVDATHDAYEAVYGLD